MPWEALSPCPSGSARTPGLMHPPGPLWVHSAGTFGDCLMENGMMEAHPAGLGAGQDNKGKRGQRRSFAVRESRGPQVSFLESPLRERRGMRSGVPGAHGLGRRPQSTPTRASAGNRRRLSRGSQVTPATPSPRRRRIPRVSWLPAPALPPILCPAAGERFLARRERGQERPRPAGGLEGKAGEAAPPAFCSNRLRL